MLIPTPLLGAAGLFVGLLILAVFAAPRVVNVTPRPGSLNLPSNTAIRITFNRSMDTLAVESRFTVEPFRSGSFSWHENTLTFQPAKPWPAGGMVTFHLTAGARSSHFLPILHSRSWSFAVGVPRIVYLWPSGEQADVYTRSLDGSETTRLTETSFGVLDYTMSYDASKIVYAAVRQDGGSDLWLLDLASGEDRLVYACPAEVRCQSLSLSPDYDIVAFEQHLLSVSVGGRPVAGPSQTWAISVDGKREAVPIGIGDHITSSPVWSQVGTLAYYNHTLMAIALVDDVSVAEPTPFNYIPNDMGLIGSWSPDGAHIVYSEIVFPQSNEGDEEQAEWEGAPFYSHIYRVEVRSGATQDLTGMRVGRVEDASPTYAPNGQWIAFTRKYLEQDRWTLGRQLWLMRADGSEARQLTDEPNLNYSSLVWSPDSTTLVFMVKNQAAIAQPANIGLIEVDGGKPRLLVEGGYLPRWIP
jgi:TolB protein